MGGGALIIVDTCSWMICFTNYNRKFQHSQILGTCKIKWIPYQLSGTRYLPRTGEIDQQTSSKGLPVVIYSIILISITTIHCNNGPRQMWK